MHRKSQPGTAGMGSPQAFMEQLCKNPTLAQLVSRSKNKRSCIDGHTVTAIGEVLIRTGLLQIPEGVIHAVLDKLVAACESSQHSTSPEVHPRPLPALQSFSSSGQATTSRVVSQGTAGMGSPQAFMEQLCKNPTLAQLVSRSKNKRSCIDGHTVTAIGEVLIRTGLLQIPEGVIHAVLDKLVAACESSQHSTSPEVHPRPLPALQSFSSSGQATTSRVVSQGTSESTRMWMKPSQPAASSVKRPRVRFTALEEDAIVYGVMKYGRGCWKKIRDDSLFNGRGPTGLRDKYRNLEKYNHLPRVEQRVNAKIAAGVNPLKELRAISRQRQQRIEPSEGDVSLSDDDGIAAPTGR
ncbi:uncharacterized protein LOC144115120 [Amblyomma americanum]